MMILYVCVSANTISYANRRNTVHTVEKTVKIFCVCRGGLPQLRPTAVVI